MKHMASTVSGKLFAPKKMKIIDIPVDQFKPAPWNPPLRTEPKRMRTLRAGMLDKGQQCPVHVNHKKMLIDGHRRLAVAREIGIPTLSAIVHDNCETANEFKELYAMLNDTQRKMSVAEQHLSYFKAGPKAIPPRSLPRAQRLERMVGREKFGNYARAGKSCTEATRNAARAALLAAQPGNEALMGELIIWQVETGRQNQLRQALDAKFEWPEIKHAMENNLDLKTRQA